jgi:hypothetical protein
MRGVGAIPRALCIGSAVVILVSLVAFAVEFSVPYGSPIDLADIDGVLGEEWDDAQRHDCRMGKYSAEVYLKSTTTSTSTLRW